MFDIPRISTYGTFLVNLIGTGCKKFKIDAIMLHTSIRKCRLVKTLLVVSTIIGALDFDTRVQRHSKDKLLLVFL